MDRTLDLASAKFVKVEEDKDQDDLNRWQGLWEGFTEVPIQQQQSLPPRRLPTPPSQMPPPLLPPELLRDLEYANSDLGNVPTHDIGIPILNQYHPKTEPLEINLNTSHTKPRRHRPKLLYKANPASDSECDHDDDAGNRASIIVRRHRQGPPNTSTSTYMPLPPPQLESLEPSSWSSSPSNVPFSFNSATAGSTTPGWTQVHEPALLSLTSTTAGSTTLGWGQVQEPTPSSFTSATARSTTPGWGYVQGWGQGQGWDQGQGWGQVQESDPFSFTSANVGSTMPVRTKAQEPRRLPAVGSSSSVIQLKASISSTSVHTGVPSAAEAQISESSPHSTSWGSNGRRATIASRAPMLMSSAETTRSIIGKNDQIIYQNLVNVLATKLSIMNHGDNSRLRDYFHSYLERVSKINRVECLAESNRCLSELLQMSSALGAASHPDIRQALDKDEKLLAGALTDTLNSREEKEAILSLKGDMAHSFLDLLQVVISKGLLDSHSANLKARRLLIKLSLRADIILASQLISGLTMLNGGQPVNGGGNADIFRALYQEKEVAVKRIRMHLGKDSQKIRRAFSKEALVWQHLKHPNVLPFLGIDSEMFTSALCMVSPWMKHGTIMDFRAAIGPSNIGIIERLMEVADGLRYLHDEGIIHGDLRGGNILIDDEWHAVLADFGLTTFGDTTMTVATRETNASGTTRWMAPELLLPEDDDVVGIKKTEASDIYAFGCVCLELYTGRPPFADITNETVVVCQLVQGKRPSLEVLRREAQIEVPEHILGIVNQCWSRLPKERPLGVDVIRVLRSRSVTRQSSRKI